MTLVALIDSNVASRERVREVAPTNWTLLEAASGLAGLDLVRQHCEALNLVIIDLELPDIAGTTVCLRIREICPELPILPFTVITSTTAALRELGCLAPVYKPARTPLLERALGEACTQAVPPISRNALVGLAREQSQWIERFARQQAHALRVVIYAEAAVMQAGLTQLLAPIAHTADVHHIAALRLLLGRTRPTAVVADAAHAPTVVPIAHEHRVPTILIAGSQAEATLLTATHDVAAVLLARDPLLATHLTATVQALAVGEAPPCIPLLPDFDTSVRQTAPPAVVQRFADAALSPREVDVVWLDAQGLSHDNIAQMLGITKATVNSHWRNISRKLGSSRHQVQAWARERL